MIWVKTEAGRAEMQERQHVRERPLRNLLLLVDGVKSQSALLQGLVGVGPDDLARLEALGLIAPLASSPSAARTPGAPPSPPAVEPVAEPVVGASPAPEADPLDYARYTAVLTGLISRELGLRGLMLTLAVEKADTVEALRAVGERVVAQVGERRGAAAAAAARRALRGE